MPSLFAGVENFVPAFQGRQLAIQEGMAMRQGLAGIEQIKDIGELDSWANDYSNDLKGSKQSIKPSQGGPVGPSKGPAY